MTKPTIEESIIVNYYKDIPTIKIEKSVEDLFNNLIDCRDALLTVKEWDKEKELVFCTLINKSPVFKKTWDYSVSINAAKPLLDNRAFDLELKDLLSRALA